LHLINTSFSAICTNQHLQKPDSGQNHSAIGVTPDPFSATTNKKWKKVVWLCKTMENWEG